MSERKVLNKYYPPDFDPSKLQIQEKKTTRRMCNVRMMLPMSVRCYTCGNYMYLGTKFNMKVETLEDEDYLGIKVFRFYFKCTRCYKMITFKTDPKNHDYISENGASRNHEQWKDMLMAEEEYNEMKKTEMKEDAMKSLEHRTYDSKREMDILDALDQVKNLNRRQANIDYNDLVEKAVKENEAAAIEKDEIEKEAKEKFNKNKNKKIDDYNLTTIDDSQISNGSTLNDSFLGHKNKRNQISENKVQDSDEDSEDKDDLPKVGSFSFSGVNLRVKKLDSNPIEKKNLIKNINNLGEKRKINLLNLVNDNQNKITPKSLNDINLIKKPLPIKKF